AATNLRPVPMGVPTEVAAAVEPLACAVHAADDAGAAPGVHVGVLGRGPLGRLVAYACLARGATCDQLGRDEGDTRSYDVVVEAAGTVEAWERAVALTRPGGTVVLFGGPP